MTGTEWVIDFTDKMGNTNERQTFLHEDDAHVHMEIRGFKFESYGEGVWYYRKGGVSACLYSR